MVPASRSTAVRLLLLAPVASLIVAGSSLLGPTRLDWSEVFHPDQDAQSGATNVFWTLRVPRALLAACAGAGLALSGVVLQALFRNPLATPYTLGIASGAALAAALGFLLKVGGYWLGVPIRSLLAFGGAISAMCFVYLMARLRAGRDMTRLLLGGVCVAYMCSAGVLLVTFLAGKAVTNDIVMWMIGSLAILRRAAAAEILVVLLPALAFTLYAHRALDLLSMSDELAASRGVAVGPIVWTCFLLVGLLTAVIVANCGPIGFVGLMVPHIARALLGLQALPLVLGSALIGAAFLAACDGIARSLSVYELPVGVITNILGAAFFFYLLATRDVSYSAGR
ncbi:MAG: FecCD family ABC transporter permease [Phycisphaerae bacterium]